MASPPAQQPPSPETLRRYWMNSEYPKEMWYFIACFIFVVAVCQWTSLVLDRVTSASRSLPAPTASDQVEKGSPSPSSGNMTASPRRVPSALLNAFRIIAFRSTIPLGKSFAVNIAEVAVTSMYIIALFTWAFVNTTGPTGQRLVPSYWANRCGVLAASQFPLIVALGSKNNVISAITRISYDRLNYLHRMVARVVFILSWVHGGSKIHRGITMMIHEPFIHSALVAVIAFSVLFLASVRPVRQKAYEFFFYMHLSMVLAILIGAYYHTKALNFDVYIWPSFVVWGFDRLIRLIRLVVFNTPVGANSSNAEQSIHARAELVTPDLVRLTMKRPKHFRWSAGQMAYLILPGVSALPFEAHPFTIASYDSPEASLAGSDEKVQALWKDLVFLINVREGFTKRLRDVAVSGGKLTTLIDGPYGSSPDSDHFDTVVLVAGGSGVSHTLPLFLHAIQRARSGNTRCKRLVFLWAVRESGHINWISSDLSSALSAAPPGLEVVVQIYVTGTAAPGQSVVSLTPSTLSDDPDTERTIASTTMLTLSGRPDLSKILAEEAETARGGRMSVSVCGSSSVAQATRKALGFSLAGPKEILRGGASVTLHVESFGYA